MESFWNFYLRQTGVGKNLAQDFVDQKGTSHRIYKTPWQGDPRVNIQSAKGKAKAYQVKQVLREIERLEYESHSQ